MAPGLLDTRSGPGSWPPQALSTQATGLGHMQGSNLKLWAGQEAIFTGTLGSLQTPWPLPTLGVVVEPGMRANAMLTLGSGPAEHHTVSPWAALSSPTAAFRNLP